MPFQSEKQRRYLWANEPEIARDWTDTYGSGIAKALGGRIGLRGGQLVQPGPGRPGYGGPHETYGGGVEAGRSSGPSDRGPRDAPDRFGPVQPASPTRSRIQEERQEDFRKNQMSDLLAQQQAEKDYTPMGQIKPGPQLGLARSGAGGGLGSMASQFIGSKIGGGLGSMLFGPWGGLLLSMFGRGVGKRGWQARQTKEKESLRDILLGENTILSSMFNKKTPTNIGGEGDFDPNARISDTSFSTGQGIGGINLGNQDYDKLKTIAPRMGMYGPRAVGLNPNDLLQDRRKRGTRLDVPSRSGTIDKSPWAGKTETEMKGRTLDNVYGLYGYTPEFREFDKWEGTQAQQENPYVRGFDLAPIPSEEDLMYGDIEWQR